MERNIAKWGFLFLVPTLLAFAVVVAVPFVLGVYLSFTEFTTIVNARFVGLDNYRRAFLSPEFQTALSFTLRFAAVTVVTVNVFAFLLALALCGDRRGAGPLRTAFFAPNLIGGIVLGYIWKLIINGLLLPFGVDITYSAGYGFWGLTAVFNWQLIGYMMMIYVASLNTIPEEVLEAARLDGAGKLAILRHIKIPMVMPAFTTATFLTLSNALKMFDQNLALTAGAPNRETAGLALDIYNTFYGRLGYEGIGQAKAVVFFLLAAALTAAQLSLTRRQRQ